MSKKIMQVSIEMMERTFDHGQISVERANEWESKLEVDVELVVGRGDEDAFHKELQDLIEKYAI